MGKKKIKCVNHDYFTLKEKPKSYKTGRNLSEKFVAHVLPK